MKKVLFIDKPYITIKDGSAFLNARVSVGEYNQLVFYRVDEKYVEALCDKKTDAFLLALLYYAMVNGYDIEWSAPCSADLFFQLTNYYIPILSKEVPFFNNISLHGDVTNECVRPEKKGVATAISGGVDSTYSIYKYYKTDLGYGQLTHVLFTDCFVYGFSEDYKKAFYDYYIPEMSLESKELGLDFIFIGCNVDEYFGIEPFIDGERGVINNYGLYSLKYCSLAYALANLISIYYFSSGQPAHDFSWISKDTDSYDLFTVSAISTQDIQFYSSGSEVTRTEKVKMISDWNFAQHHLQVCAMRHDNNCGLCNKCIRTMSELYSIDKLELFKMRFPVEDYLKNYNKRMGYIIWQARTGHLDEEQLLTEMKKANKKVYFTSYIWALHYSLKNTARNIFKNNKIARFLYEKLNLGKYIYGDLYKYYKEL